MSYGYSKTLYFRDSQDNASKVWKVQEHENVQRKHGYPQKSVQSILSEGRKTVLWVSVFLVCIGLLVL